MASTKMGTYMRDQIRGRLLHHRFSEEEKKLKEDMEFFAFMVWRSLFKDGTLAYIETLPKGWLPEQNYIKVEIAGQVVQLNFGRDVTMPYCMSKSRILETYDGRHAFSERWLELSGRKKDLDTAKSALRRELDAALKQASTVQRLVKIWPEVLPFVKDFMDEDKPKPAQLPAVPLTILNTKLGLGPKAQEA